MGWSTIAIAPIRKKEESVGEEQDLDVRDERQRRMAECGVGGPINGRKKDSASAIGERQESEHA